MNSTEDLLRQALRRQADRVDLNRIRVDKNALGALSVRTDLWPNAPRRCAPGGYRVHDPDGSVRLERFVWLV